MHFVTHPCHIPLLAQARPMMLCIYTSLLVYCVCGTYVFRICILPYLCVIQYFHCMSKDIAKLAKLATLESQKEAVVCTTHLWNPKIGEKG